MAFTSGFLKDRITVLNRTKAETGEFGPYGNGVSYAVSGELWSNVDWQKGKAPLNSGALDSYAVVLVRMRWTDLVTRRSRIVFDGTTYQVLPDTFHADWQGNTIQFLAQEVINN